VRERSLNPYTTGTLYRLQLVSLRLIVTYDQKIRNAALLENPRNVILILKDLSTFHHHTNQELLP